MRHPPRAQGWSPSPNASSRATARRANACCLQTWRSSDTRGAFSLRLARRPTWPRWSAPSASSMAPWWQRRWSSPPTERSPGSRTRFRSTHRRRAPTRPALDGMFHAGPLTFGVVIGHEGWRYPETVRWAVRRGAHLVVHPHFHVAAPGAYIPTTFADPANTFHEKAVLCRGPRCALSGEAPAQTASHARAHLEPGFIAN
jgi:hypothetical protein